MNHCNRRRLPSLSARALHPSQQHKLAAQWSVQRVWSVRQSSIIQSQFYQSLPAAQQQPSIKSRSMHAGPTSAAHHGASAPTSPTHPVNGGVARNLQHINSNVYSLPRDECTLHAFPTISIPLCAAAAAFGSLSETLATTPKVLGAQYYFCSCRPCGQCDANK
jgi:hypothetical protein